MTLVVHAGIYRKSVIRHLARLVPPEVWTVDSFGFVDLVGTVPAILATPAVKALQAIVGAPGLVEVHGSEAAVQFVVDGGIKKMSDVGGAAFIDETDLGPQARVPIIYDVTDNYVNGYWVRGADGTKIDLPVHILLGHEFAHALDALEGTYTKEIAEVTAITMENVLRAADTPVLPARGTHEGGPKDPPKKSSTTPTTAPKSKGGCFIAAAVLASGDSERLDALRRFRDCRVRSIARGAAYMDDFYSCYGDLGPRLAAAAEAEGDQRKALLALVVAPVLGYLALAVQCPDEALDTVGLPAAWAAFIDELQAGLECWAVSAVPPRIDAPFNDIEFVARYVLRFGDSRRTFVDSVRAGKSSAALCDLVTRAKDRFARVQCSIEQPNGLADLASDVANPMVLAAAALLHAVAVRELGALRSSFQHAGLAHVYDTAFAGPLVHFARLAAALPDTEVPAQIPASWRAVVEQLRADVESLATAVLAQVGTAIAADCHEGSSAHGAVGSGPMTRAATAFGNDIGTVAQSIRWRYTVTVRNADTDNATYLNLRVYYLAQPGGPEDMGVVMLANLASGEVAVFPLCECGRLMSYRIEGDLILPNGQTGDFEFPDNNGMTAKRAGDAFACEDSWAF